MTELALHYRLDIVGLLREEDGQELKPQQPAGYDSNLCQHHLPGFPKAVILASLVTSSELTVINK